MVGTADDEVMSTIDKELILRLLEDPEVQHRRAG
jgi:hypothetical protein